MRNAEVAAILNRIADLLEIKGENFYKIRAYREAVRQLDNLSVEVEDLIRQGKLKGVPGIGSAIEQKIVEFVESGHLQFLDRLESEIPPALLGGSSTEHWVAFFGERDVCVEPMLEAGATD